MSNLAPHRSSIALRRLPLFAGVSEARLERLAQQCHLHHLRPRQQLLMRSDARRDVFLLLAGSLRVTSYSASGRQVSFRDSKEGDWFGDLAAIDGGLRCADVVTLKASTVARVDSRIFMDLLRDEPLIAERVLRHLSALVRQLSERVIELSTLGVRKRLHAELLRLARSAGVVENASRLEPAPLHESLGSRISTNREEVTRELAVLYRSGVIVKEGKAMLVADVALLNRMVAELPDQTFY